MLVESNFFSKYYRLPHSFLHRYASPGTIKSTSNKLWVKFVSDGTVNKGGFQASFTKEFDECAARKNPCDHTCINMDGTC